MSKSHSLEPLAYSIKGAMAATSLGRARLYQLIKEGKLESRKLGRRTVILADSLRRLTALEQRLVVFDAVISVPVTKEVGLFADRHADVRMVV